MKRPSFQDKADGIFGVYQAEKSGKRFKSGAKDGSIPTHPVVPCDDLPEAEVLKQCLKWLRSKRGVLADRLNVGAGHLEGTERFHTYGIPGAGDIIGSLPNGRHFEIECKAGKGGRLSKKQQKRREKVLASNGIYVTVHSVNELEYYWKRIEQENEL